MVFVCRKSNLKNTFETIILMQRLYMTNRVIGSSLSGHPFCPGRAKMECYRPRNHLDCQVTDFSTTRIKSSSIAGRYLRLTGGLVGEGSVLPICWGAVDVFISLRRPGTPLVTSANHIWWKKKMATIFLVFSENI